MGQVSIQGSRLDVDLVVFDKDGTLIAFEPVWGWRTVQATEQLAAAAPLPAEVVRVALLENLGYDAAAAKTDPHGPLAAAAMSKLYTIAAMTLYQLGLSWGRAEQLVIAHFVPQMNDVPPDEQVTPLGDVQGVFRRLRRADIPLAVITSDERKPTEAALRALGVLEQLQGVICADDPFPQKPAPGGVLHLCQQLEARPAHTLLVGDTTTDMMLAENAGLGWRAQVVGFGEKVERLPADFHIETVDMVGVVSGE